MNEKEFIKYVKSLGFIFPQGEFCIKGNMKIVFDCYPYLIECEGKSMFFKTRKQFKKFYNENT